jgi:hypothetical protein
LSRALKPLPPACQEADARAGLCELASRGAANAGGRSRNNDDYRFPGRVHLVSQEAPIPPQRDPFDTVRRCRIFASVVFR